MRNVRLLFAAAFCILLSSPMFADSHVRIVRLSYLEGGVQVNRTGQFEPAILNLPITQGTKLRTAADGRAEVEFEDGSTIRLAPNTDVQFTQLVLKDNGTKVSTVELSNGTEYADIAGAKGNDLSLKFGGEKVESTRAARFRIDESKSGSSVAVFKGDVQVMEASGTVLVRKNQTATFDASADSHATLAKKITPEPLDSWEKQQSQYHERYAVNSYKSFSPYSYGSADLAYYGGFFAVPGYGMLWQPYLAGAGWDPFMDGAWAFSPGFGYGWVSAYPWGWLPYHYGNWVFLPSYGWAWQPGGVWMPWYTQPMLRNAPTGFTAPRRPTAIAVRGPSIIAVNRGPASTLTAKSGNKIVLRNNSAGLGVPRGRVANLGDISRNVQRRGEVTQKVHPTMVSRPMPPYGGYEPNGMPSERGMGPGPRVGRSIDRAPAPEPRMSPPPMAPAPRSMPHK